MSQVNANIFEDFSKLELTDFYSVMEINQSMMPTCVIKPRHLDCQQEEGSTCTSPDSMVSSLSFNKKDKFCLVCGDKALGYNFNAVSCESCKAFFRRNAHKTIRGRCEGKCEVTVDSRSFCKKCRLSKCFTVGMRKDMILSEQQKKVRKQKIIINKLKKHSTLSPVDDTSQEDVESSLEAKISAKSYEELRYTFPNLSEKDLKLLIKLKEEKTEKPEESKKPQTDFPVPEWSDTQDFIHEIISEFSEMEKCIIKELIRAHEQSGFLANTSTEMRSLPTNATEFVNVAESFVRRIIRVAKNIEFFKMISKDDQIALLKGSVVEIMMLRSAVNYDVVNETWTLNTGNVLRKEEKTNASSSSSSSSSMSSSIAPATQGSPNTPTDLSSRKFAQGSSKCEAENMVTSSMAGIDKDAFLLKAKNFAQSFSADKMNSEENMKKMTKAFGDHGSDSLENMKKMASQFAGKNLSPEKLRQLAGMNSQGKPFFEKMNNMSTVLPTDSSSSSSSEMVSCSSENVKNQGIPNMSDLKQIFQEKMKSGGMEGMGDLSGLKAMFEKRMRDAGLSPTETQDKISAELLKFGNPETRALFMSYSKFIKSLMKTIKGDLLALKLLIMLSLFSADRQGLEHKEKIQEIQECYATILQRYIVMRFPDDKTLFARILMKLTDLRDINEIHTKMLLKMKVDNIEPLLVEIFDIPS